MQTEIIILGHGSRRAEANQGLLEVAERVSESLGQKADPAFMSHGSPSLPEVVREKILSGAKRIIIMPLFLFPGVHVTVDIHEELREIREEFPNIEIIFTKELGVDESIVQLVIKRIEGVVAK